MSVEKYSPENDSSQAVSMTTAAIAHTRSQLEQKDGALGMRLSAKKSGCSGFMYHVELVTEQGEDDRVFPVAEGLAVYVDLDSLPYVAGTEIDFVQDGLSRVFKFNNPRAKNTCGCGESFSI